MKKVLIVITAKHTEEFYLTRLIFLQIRKNCSVIPGENKKITEILDKIKISKFVNGNPEKQIWGNKECGTVTV